MIPPPLRKTIASGFVNSPPDFGTGPKAKLFCIRDFRRFRNRILQLKTNRMIAGSELESSEPAIILFAILIMTGNLPGSKNVPVFPEAPR